MKHIVVFGETGAGNSSVINLMAGKEVAVAPDNPSRRTLKWEEYSFGFDGCDYRVFDVVGLEQPQLETQEYLEAIVNARDLVVKLESDGGIDLLLFCMRVSRVTATLKNNYRIFYEWLCEKKVPIVFVLTGLETEQNMEDWWAKNKFAFDRYNIVVDDHACIVASNTLDGRHQRLYEESRQLVRDLVREHTYGRLGGWKGGDGWFRRFMYELRVLCPGIYSMKVEDAVTILTKHCGIPAEAALELAKQMSTKNIVLFGQTGAGKSSVINLMAGEEIASTSPDMERCTMQWKKYPITFDGFNYKVFDTIGLEDAHLGVQEYLDAIVNARNLVMKLKDEGGIDLLLFCVRAGRFSSTLQKNYRLFHNWLCEKKVPIVLVLTGLEREENMEDWWTTYNYTLDKYKIIVDGHACITAANNLDGRHKLLYEESRPLIRNLVRKHTYDRPEGNAGWQGDDGWFRRFISKLNGLLLGNPSMKKDFKSVLTKRCGMPPEAALELAKHVQKELRPKKSTLFDYIRSFVCLVPIRMT